MHGVPASSFVYRKVVDELAARGMRGVAFDLPGAGLSERPEGFDYSWSGLGRFSVAAVDQLGLDQFHLVVHDIGGPVGFEVAAALPERVRSLTILNTLIEADSFHRPWMMEPYARTIGRLWLAATNRASFRVMMYYSGIRDRNATSAAEIDAYVELLKLGDGGRAFLKTMRGFETTHAKGRLYASVLRDATFPIQVVWGANDPALKLSVYGERARKYVPAGDFHVLPGKHFLQEDQAGAIADRVAAMARR
jgi:pimeloyl-ACP methyl ester carboxylesterase